MKKKLLMLLSVLVVLTVLVVGAVTANAAVGDNIFLELERC